MPCTSQFKSKEFKMLTSLKFNAAILMIAFFLANYEVVWWFGDSGAEPWVRVTRVIITVVSKVLLALALYRFLLCAYPWSSDRARKLLVL